MYEIIGVDSDSLGAACVIKKTDKDSHFTCNIYYLPTEHIKTRGKKRRTLDIAKTIDLFNFIINNNTAAIFIEQQQAAPMQGVSSMFAFGKTYGIILTSALGAITNNNLNLKLETVRPVVWKRKLGVSRDKKITVERATSIADESLIRFWKLKKHTSAAESFLIALYGLSQQENISIDDLVNFNFTHNEEAYV